MAKEELSRRERKKRETRDRILTVTREMAESHGSTVPLEQIAEAADVSKATFYNYFPNGDMLWREAALAENQEVREQLAQEAASLGSPLATLHRVMELMFSETSPYLRNFRATVLRGFSDPKQTVEIFDGVLNHREGEFIGLVSEVKDMGELRSDLDAGQTARALMAVYTAASLLCEYFRVDPALSGNEPSITAVAAAVMESIGLVPQATKRD